MKHPTVDLGVSSTEQTRRRRRRAPKKPLICPDDDIGPRIPALFLEFAQNSPIPTHLEWLHHLELSCEKQRCFATRCHRRTKQDGRPCAFARAHGAKTLINGLNLFLSYYLPRYYCVSSDEEWRSALAAMRSFHDYCVRRRYIRDDAALKQAFHRLIKFPIATIVLELQALIDSKYWHSLEYASSSEKETVRDLSRSAQGESYEAFLGGALALCVVDVTREGWLLEEDWDDGAKGFLSLPEDVATLGRKGMSFSHLSLGLMNQVWRPVVTESYATSSIVLYPPDEVFIDE